jgi:KaiC/GvpD/RAD55 family RecA-like ATPase
MINRGEYVKIKNVFLNNYMTYDEKKSLYESIMKEVAKTVKRRINEDFNGDKTYTLYFEEYGGKIKGTVKIFGNDYEDLMLNVDAIIEASDAVGGKVYVKFSLHNNSEKRNFEEFKEWRKTVDYRTEQLLVDRIHEIAKYINNADDIYEYIVQIKRYFKHIGVKIAYNFN